MQRNTLRSLIGATLLAGMAGAAQAHTGHGALSLMQGLAHPLGLDHLLAMVAVGTWSVSALPSNKTWQGPATFMLALSISAALGMAGITVPYLEHAIALSVALFGVMLMASRTGMSTLAGLAVIAAAASLHGLAHGAETPASGFAGYAVGFLWTTATLHLGGVGISLAIQRWLAERSGVALGAMGAALGGAGLFLFGQLAI